MKKNKLLFGIGMISIILLSSCGETFTKNRGQEETFPEVSIPDVLRPTEGSQDKDSITYTVKHALEMENGEYQTVCVETLSSKKGEKTNASPKAYNGYKAEEFSQVDVEADGSTVVTIKYKMQKYSITLTGNQFEGSLAGSGEYSIVDGAAVLTAKPYIGYSFLGWYRDDTLLSNKPTYSLTLSSDMNIKGLFKIKDEFKNYEIETNESSCTILKQLDDKERVVSIPEGVTGIAYNAFNSYCLRILTLPKSLKRIESQAFYTPSLVKVTINSDCIFYDGAFDSVYPIEVYDLSENGHNEYFIVDGIHLTEIGREAYVRTIYDSIYENYLNEYKEQRNKILKEKEDSYKQTISFYGNDMLLNAFSLLKEEFPVSKYITNNDFNYESLKEEIINSKNSDTLPYKIVFIFDKSINITDEEMNNIIKLCDNHEIYIVSNKKYDKAGTIDFYKEIEGNSEYLMADKIHLSESGNKALVNLLVKTLKD